MEWGARAYDWVGDLSARRASLSPDRTAVVEADAGRSYSYDELDSRANATARLLEARGVVDGERVALVSRNRTEAFELFFATGKVGGVLAPLSHRLAPPELAELLERIEPQLLVVETPFLASVESALEGADAEPTLLELAAEDPVGDPSAVRDVRPADTSPVEGRPRSLADPYLLVHTGGSTGLPKVTTITHGSIHWNSFNTITAWGLRPDDVAPMPFPTFHTGGWNVLTIPLFQLGGTVVVDRTVDPGRLLRTVEAHGATVLAAVPTVLRAMADHDRWDDADLSTLRFVKSGGGPCRESVREAWRARGVTVSQGYGLTEIGPNNFAMPDEFEPAATASVGKPVLHTDVRIVDDGEPVAAGEVGELELAGPHAAAGYWRDREATAEAFGGGWLSTGDLARVDDEGFYHIEGRVDDAFHSGGETVHPAAVEDAIADHPAVADAVVVGVPDERWGTVGKAVIEPATDEPVTLAELESFLDGRLARFKIPKELTVVDELPTAGPAKVDRAAVEERFGGE